MNFKGIGCIITLILFLMPIAIAEEANTVNVLVNNDDIVTGSFGKVTKIDNSNLYTKSEKIGLLAAPVLSDNIPDITIVENSSESVNLSLYFSDADNDTLNYSYTLVENITVSIVDSEANLTPDSGFVGSRSIIFNATDGNETVSSNNVTIIVEAIDYDFEDIGDVVFPEDDRGQDVSTSFVVKNIGNVNLTDVEINDSIDAKYNVSYNITSLGTLGVDESITVEVTATIPDDEPFGEDSIGTVDITSNELNESFTLKINVREEGGLRIEEVEIIIDGDSDTLKNDGENSEDTAKPGSDIRLNIKVENTFESNEDIDIEDITITATIKDIDDGEDIEEDSEEFDISADRSKSKPITLELPLELDERTYDIEILVEGDSDEGNHDDEWSIQFRVDKRSHDIIITKASLEEGVVSCGGSTKLNLEVLNIGTNYEDDVTLEAKNKDLVLSFKRYNIDLDETPWEDETRYETKIDINVPDDLKTGTYPIVVKVYYSRDVLDDLETLNLEVRCKEEEVPPEIPSVNETVEEEPVVNITEPGEEEEEIVPPASDITSSVESSLIKNPSVFALLVVGNIIVLGLIGFLGYKILYKK